MFLSVLYIFGGGEIRVPQSGLPLWGADLAAENRNSDYFENDSTDSDFFGQPIGTGEHIVFAGTRIGCRPLRGLVCPINHHLHDSVSNLAENRPAIFTTTDTVLTKHCYCI